MKHFTYQLNDSLQAAHDALSHLAEVRLWQNRQKVQEVLPNKRIVSEKFSSISGEGRRIWWCFGAGNDDLIDITPKGILTELSCSGRLLRPPSRRTEEATAGRYLPFYSPITDRCTFSIIKT